MNMFSRARRIVEEWVQWREYMKRLNLERVLTYAVMSDAVALYMEGAISHEAFGKMLEGKLLVPESFAIILDEIKKAHTK